jgi:hypothetical protein
MVGQSLPWHWHSNGGEAEWKVGVDEARGEGVSGVVRGKVVCGVAGAMHTPPA